MNTSVEGIIVNNCQYAPIYLIQDPGATQGNTYVLASSTVEPPKPVSNNLKTFYENSGNIENGLITADTGIRSNAIKKRESVLIRNNLKLASFLLPKHDNVNKQFVVDNIVLKPTITTTASSPVPINHHSVNTVPKIDIDRKIVKLKEVPIINRHRPEKVLPKIKPKENTPSPTQSKYTSVQLIKLGETYHSLNQLSDEQIKMVNQALAMFNDPDKSAPEPTYDPVTNTKYIYKVVSPKDLTVVAKKKILLKDRKNHTKIPKRAEENVKHVNPEKLVKHVNPEKVFKHVNPEKVFKHVNPEKVFKHVNPEKVVKHVNPEKAVKHLNPEKVFKHVNPEKVFKHVNPEKVVKHVNPETVFKHVNPEKVVKHVNPEKAVKHLNPEKAVKHLNPEKVVKHVIPENVVKHVNPEKVVRHVIPEKVARPVLPEKVVKPVIPKELPILKEDSEEEFEPEPPAEAKVTRSGRKVKLPKQILPEGSPHKTKKKSGTIVSCFQCAADFGSLYRLQKHYENHPTHIPAKIHSNLFHCLLAILKSGSDENKTNIFIQQLEQLIVKLKSLLPCLLKKVDGTDGQPCTINEDIGRLFGMNPGKYNIDVEALNCVKDKNGYCIHNPPKISPIIRDQNKPSPHLLQHADIPNPDNETENCARINSVAKWPTVSKRIWKLKHKTHEQSAKKMRLKSESDTLIELGTEDFMFTKEGDNVNAASIVPENNMNTADMISEDDVAKMLENAQDCNINCEPEPEPQTDRIIMDELSKPKNNYVQFHSAHFDIRSSPIKPSSTVFRKFQINPSKMSNYDVQVIRSLEMVNNKAHDKRVPLSNPDRNLHVPLPHSESNFNPQNSDNGLHANMPNTDTRQHVAIPNSNKGLHVSISDSLLGTLTNSDSLQHVTIPHSHKNGLDLHTSLANSDNRLHVTMSDSKDRLHVNMLNSNNDLHVTKSNSNNDLIDDIQNMGDRLHVTIPNPNDNLHVTLPDTDSRLHVSIPNSDDGLHVAMSNSNGLHLTLPSSDENLRLIIPTSENSLDVNISNSDSLHDLFKNDVDLCKDSDVIDPDLKDWIISTSEKSEDGFAKSSSLIAPSLLHVRDSVDKSLDSHKNINHCDDMPSLDDSSDNRLLSSQGESVLNFLDTLGNDLYPETEIRNNGVDFQLDLFAYHHS